MGFELAGQERHEMGGERVYGIQDTPIGKPKNIQSPAQQSASPAASLHSPVTELDSVHSAVELDRSFTPVASPGSASPIAEMAGTTDAQAKRGRRWADEGVREGDGNVKNSKNKEVIESQKSFLQLEFFWGGGVPPLAHQSALATKKSYYTSLS
jgi:hypothetical protein